MSVVYHKSSGPGSQSSRRYQIAMISILALIVMSTSVSCMVKTDYMSKVSGVLLEQVELRREQIAMPDDERLKQMQDMGLSTGDLNKQLVFVYVEEHLSDTQVEELSALGVDVHEDSWIPAVGNHLLGFFIAEMPVDKLEELAARDYIIRLDTGERQSQSVCPVTNY